MTSQKIIYFKEVIVMANDATIGVINEIGDMDK